MVKKKIEIVPVGAAWMVTKATCRVFLTGLRDFLAVSQGDVLEKWASTSAFWLCLRVDGSLIIFISDLYSATQNYPAKHYFLFHVAAVTQHLAEHLWSSSCSSQFAFVQFHNSILPFTPWLSKRFWVPSGLLGCFAKSNTSIFQLQHKKGNLLIDNVPDIAAVIAYFESGVVTKHGCRTTAQNLMSQAEYRSIWLWRHCHVTFAFKCYLVSFKWSSCQIWGEPAWVMLLCC